MATKKPATNKPAARKTATKSTAARKPAARKAPARKQTTVRTVSAASTRPAKRPFFSLRPNHETVYWLILTLAILALGAWVVNLADKVNQTYDQVEEAQSQIETIRTTKE